jgi:hypothetical protein
MYRRKLNPVTAFAFILSLTLIVFMVALITQNTNYKRLHGMTVKDDIFKINELTDDVSAALSSGDLTKLVYLSGQLDRCVVGGEINADFDKLRSDTAAAVYAYATASRDESVVSPSALALLQSDAAEKNDLLHKTVQFIMEKLNSTNTNKMNLNYFNALSESSRVHKLISSFIANGGTKE